MDKCPSCTFQRKAVKEFRTICRSENPPLRCSLSPIGVGRHFEAAFHGRDSVQVADAMAARFKLARTRGSGDGTRLSPIILCNPHCPSRLHCVGLLTNAKKVGKK